MAAQGAEPEATSKNRLPLSAESGPSPAIDEMTNLNITGLHHGQVSAFLGMETSRDAPWLQKGRSISCRWLRSWSRTVKTNRRLMLKKILRNVTVVYIFRGNQRMGSSSGR